MGKTKKSDGYSTRCKRFLQAKSLLPRSETHLVSSSVPVFILSYYLILSYLILQCSTFYSFCVILLFFKIPYFICCSGSYGERIFILLSDDPLIVGIQKRALSTFLFLTLGEDVEME